MSAALSPGVRVMTPTLRSLARDAVIETSTPDEAATALLRKVQGNQEHIRAILRVGASDLVRGARSDSRASLSNEHLGHEKGLKRHVAAMRGLAQLYDWKLPVTGKRLADATVADLADAADWHAARSEVEMRRSRMYRAVQECLARSNHATVIEGIAPAELARIMQGAEPDYDDDLDE